MCEFAPGINYVKDGGRSRGCHAQVKNGTRPVLFRHDSFHHDLMDLLLFYRRKGFLMRLVLHSSLIKRHILLEMLFVL